MTDLALRAWRRSDIYDLVTGGRVNGRLGGSLPLVIFDPANPSDRVEDTADFVIASARDVIRLAPSEIAAVAPAAGSMNAETTKAVHIEFRETDLPWRYTPQTVSGDRLRPWLALLVGTADEIEIHGATATFAPTVLDDHDLARSARWAHVDEGGARQVARLLSPRSLVANADQVAVLVRAFNDNGTAAWVVPAVGPVTLATLHHWRFRTDDAGDFVTLAARLKARIAPPELGRVSVRYDRIAPAVDLEAYGALAPIGAQADPIPPSVAVDLAALRLMPADPRGRPVIGLPDYGRDWLPPMVNATWSDTLNGDPRFRVQSGFGRKAGIALQHEIMEEAERQAGALDVSHRLIADASLGLAAAQSLFSRRLPNDSLARLWVLGPGMRRVATAQGTVYDRLSRDDRPMPPALLSSSAARRLFRSGGVLGRRTRPGAVNPVAILRRSNICALPPEKVPKGLPHADKLARFDVILKRNAERKTDPRALIKRLDTLDVSDCPRHVQEQIRELAQRFAAQADSDAKFPYSSIITLINLIDGKKGMSEEDFLITLGFLIETFDDTGEGDDIGRFGAGLIRDRNPRPCRPTDLETLSNGLTTAFDPSSPQAGTVVRLRERIGGLPEPLLQPPRFCPEIDLPLWRWLRDAAADWLLPGAQALNEDDVTALATNPRFVDGFMVGVNHQTLAEFRWRNLRVAAQCTPLKRFWDIAEPTTGLAIDTIRPIRLWPTDSILGAPSHQPPSAGAADLILAFRSPLFERYPGTVVYLLEAPVTAGEPDFNADPDLTRPRSFPVFQGILDEQVNFFGFDIPPIEGRRYWVVLEESAPSYRFRTSATDTWAAERVSDFNAARNNNNVNGAIYGRDTFNDPVRVMIRGTALVPEVS